MAKVAAAVVVVAMMEVAVVIVVAAAAALAVALAGVVEAVCSCRGRALVGLPFKSPSTDSTCTPTMV